MNFLGLDFEASGSNPWGEHVPIQIGMFVPGVNKRITYLIGGWNWSEWEWNEEAFGVHKITKEELEKADPVWKVDIKVAADLLDIVGARMGNVTVGFNVAGYDRQFVTRWMPNLNRILSYRTADLSAMIYLLVGDSDRGYKKLKAESKEYALSKMDGQEFMFHDAGFDAEAAIYEMEYLRMKAVEWSDILLSGAYV